MNDHGTYCTLDTNADMCKKKSIDVGKKEAESGMLEERNEIHH